MTCIFHKIGHGYTECKSCPHLSPSECTANGRSLPTINFPTLAHRLNWQSVNALQYLKSLPIPQPDTYNVPCVLDIPEDREFYYTTDKLLIVPLASRVLFTLPPNKKGALYTFKYLGGDDLIHLHLNNALDTDTLTASVYIVDFGKLFSRSVDKAKLFDILGSSLYRLRNLGNSKVVLYVPHSMLCVTSATKELLSADYLNAYKFTL